MNASMNAGERHTLFARALLSDRPTLAIVAASIAATAAVGCTAVLGMPAPTEEAVSIDAAPDTSPGPVMDGGRADAPPDPDGVADGGSTDAPPDTVTTVGPLRCGGGDLGDASFCTGSSPICCMRIGDAGPTYACSTASECPHQDAYPIGCAGPQDCAHNSVCCHYSSHAACTMVFDGGAAAAADDCNTHGVSVVCSQGMNDQCPIPGTMCSMALDPDGVYYGCSQ
jgi:hypothetical protein